MKNQFLTEAEIDNIVIMDADNVEQWETPIYVQPERQATLTLPSELTARAQFLAKLHKRASLEEWLQTIIQERIIFEESVYFSLKQTISS